MHIAYTETFICMAHKYKKKSSLFESQLHALFGADKFNFDSIIDLKVSETNRLRFFAKTLKNDP